MKITKSQIKQLVFEELQRLDEIPTWRKNSFYKRGTLHPGVPPRPHTKEPPEEKTEEEKAAEIEKLLSHLSGDREKVEREMQSGKRISDILSNPWARTKLMKYVLEKIAALQGEDLHYSLRESSSNRFTVLQIKNIIQEEFAEVLEDFDSAGWPSVPPGHPKGSAGVCITHTRAGTKKLYKGDEGYEECVQSKQKNEVSSEKQRRWACAQKDKPASERADSLSAAEADEMCRSKIEEDG